MDVTLMQTVNVQLPCSDLKLLRELAKKMGWIAKKVKNDAKLTELDKAILDVKKGNVKTFGTVKDMMDYLEA